MRLSTVREQCIQAGMDDFLSKPFDEVQVGETFKRWLSHRQQPTPPAAPAEEAAAGAASGAAPAAAAAKPAVPAAAEHAAQTQPADATSDIDMTAIERIRALPRRGPQSVLDRVLAEFARSAPKLVNEVKEAVQRGDTEAAWRAAHSLKSSAANLGAQRLSGRAKELEALGRKGAGAEMAAMLPGLDEDLEGARRGLKGLMENAT